MSTIVMDKKDELIMKLVHYFVTEENYNPIVVNGVKDEIWLENQDGPYRIVRINSNSIFNKEQLNYDYFKIDNIVKQIKKKTLSFKVDTLNILLNVNEDLEVEGTKNITPAVIKDNNIDITSENILEAFPDINDKLLKDTNGIELIVNVTKDINEKTEKENRMYERTFMPKKTIFTYLIVITCVIMFIITALFDGFSSILGGFSTETLLRMGAVFEPYVVDNQEYYRLFSCMFLHAGIIHLLVNMYTLVIIGTQIENFLGKWKFLIIYIVSGITGAMLSCILGNNVVSVGASGAIFGLLGSLLYFGFHYRTYLGDTVKSQVVPVIILNLAIGFIVPNIDNWAHLGGLAGGFLITMALGIDGKSKKSDKINGIICFILYVAILTYLLFFR